MKTPIAVRALALLLVGGALATGCGKDSQLETDITETTPPVTTDTTPTDNSWQTQTETPTTPEPEVIRLSLAHVYFDYDQAELRSDARRVLDENVLQLKARPDVSVVIEGHCDERGTVEYNLALGQRRAHATMNYLTRRGIDPSRITVVSYGEERPADPSHTEMAYAKNRRAQFRVREG